MSFKGCTNPDKSVVLCDNGKPGGEVSSSWSDCVAEGAKVYVRHGCYAVFWTQDVRWAHSRSVFETSFLQLGPRKFLKTEILAKHRRHAAFGSQRGGARTRSRYSARDSWGAKTLSTEKKGEKKIRESFPLFLVIKTTSWGGLLLSIYFWFFPWSLFFCFLRFTTKLSLDINCDWSEFECISNNTSQIANICLLVCFTVRSAPGVPRERLSPDVGLNCWFLRWHSLLRSQPLLDKQDIQDYKI